MEIKEKSATTLTVGGPKMYERLNQSSKNSLAYRITKPLNSTDIKKITAELEGSISVNGKIRVLIDLQAFPYENLGAFWEDLKFDVKHGRDIERLALVGGGKIEKWSVRIFGTFTFTECRFFSEGDVEKAWNWLVAEKES